MAAIEASPMANPESSANKDANIVSTQAKAERSQNEITNGRASGSS